MHKLNHLTGKYIIDSDWLITIIDKELTDIDRDRCCTTIEIEWNSDKEDIKFFANLDISFNDRVIESLELYDWDLQFDGVSKVCEDDMLFDVKLEALRDRLN